MDFLAGDGLTQLLTMLALLSVAVERLNAIVINVVNLDERITNAKYNSAVKQGLAALFGAVLYYTSSGQHLAIIDQNFNSIIGPIIVGLLASGGSGFWNSVLKAVSSVSKPK